MSVFQTRTFPCPACGADNAVQLVHSLHTERSPDLRDAILDGTFQTVACNACEETFRIDPELTVLDTHRNQWLAVLPANASHSWGASEARAHQQFQRSFGPKAPRIARELGADLTARVVFGWGALREKMVARDHTIDDIDLELMKLAVLRGAGGTVPGPDYALRLVDVAAETLTLAWVHRRTDAVNGGMTVPRALLLDVVGTAWQPLRADVSAGLYVDVNRLLDAPAVS